MLKLFSVVVPFLVSVVLIDMVGELLILRATQQEVMGGSPSRPGPSHEVDRDASAGAMFT